MHLKLLLLLKYTILHVQNPVDFVVRFLCNPLTPQKNPKTNCKRLPRKAQMWAGLGWCPQLTCSTCHFCSEVNWRRHACCIGWQEACAFLRISTTRFCCRTECKGRENTFLLSLLFFLLLCHSDKRTLICASLQLLNSTCLRYDDCRWSRKCLMWFPAWRCYILRPSAGVNFPSTATLIIVLIWIMGSYERSRSKYCTLSFP